MVDLVLGIGFLGAGASGYRRGAMRDIQAIIGLVLGLLVARAFSGVALSYITGWIAAKTTYGQYLSVIAPYFLKTFVFLLIFRITQSIVRSTLNLSDLPGPFKAVDHLAGFGVGVIKFVFILWLCITLIGTVPLPAEVSTLISDSTIVSKLSACNILSSWINGIITKVTSLPPIQM